MNHIQSRSVLRLFTLALPLALAAAACDNKPTEGKSQAQVAAPVVTTAAPAASPATAGSGQAPAAAKAVKYVFSNDGSKVAFVGAKVTGKHEGSFGAFSGTIQLVDGKPEASSVTAEIDIGSIAADQQKLTDHLKSADFFDAVKLPKAKFTSTSVKAGGDKGASHTITGNLEMHGVAKSISFPATLKVQGDTVDCDAEFGINRKDFELKYPGKPDDLIKDDVLIKLTIRAKKG